MTEKKNIKKFKIDPPKGRPMLYWAGKKPLDYVKGFPARLSETFDPQKSGKNFNSIKYSDLQNDWHNLLFYGDNKEVLATLLENGFRGKVDLIYIDPPFDSGANYVRKAELRGMKGSKLEGEDYTPIEQTMYFDIWKNDSYLQWMYERLQIIKELLSESGVIYLHCDHRKTHHLRMLLEEIFSEDNYLNTISWRSQVPRGRKADAFYYAYSTHYIHIFGKNKIYPSKWQKQTSQRLITKDEAGRDYMHDEGGYFRTSDPGSYTFESLLKAKKENRIYVSNGGKVIFDEKNKTVKTVDGTIGIKYYLKQKGNKYIVAKTIDNLWDDIPGLGTAPAQDTGYPTQKTEQLMNRIIEASTEENDLVLDCFAGSGTTMAVAQKLGRRWIGCDINKGAIQTTSKRLQKIIKDQIKNKEDAPAYLFGAYQVNDYDLQVLRTEAVELAVEHIGIERRKTDSFFDGLLGLELAKVIDFNHPLGMLDVQLLEDELKKRKDTEERNIVLVCLGKELAIDPWLEEWNKKHPINKIRVIELRTDKKYGKFLIHEPAVAKVNIKRKGKNKAIIEIKDFNSPTIIERINPADSLLKVKIPDFKAMIDVVLIDTNYNGKTFNIVLSDVPEKKTDYVEAKYELEIPQKKTKIAVKIVDMLGEETVEVKEI